ncbi:M15 family metallopeptidase [Lysinibacillus piscis]|uniref:D-Ala-D-Ala carboxypeptidase VanY n=1 Tax=Lysinibacillus piscis TaxID=2518931 RepID=A0ABQ5NME5_9BACI|nr:M15 family metallopeptidase [Lysinibacillus sp. KH24]GLC89477.1 D-Ala-D-Ala carboxypeptidase VanY [Lysinibacillus sp. KH24]
MKKIITIVAICIIGGWFIIDNPFKHNQTNNHIAATSYNEQVYQGDLLLVNHDFPVKKDYIPTDIVNALETNTNNYYMVLYNDILISEYIKAPFEALMEQAYRDGISTFLVSSGFRSFAEQQKLYDEYGSKSALPAGYSEHNLGLSLDIGSTQGRMEDTAEGQWLADNVWQYGFIMRYPKNKTRITNIKYEPWHIRYVGLPHSLLMRKKNLALEEYLAFLKTEQTVYASVNGQDYTIKYYEGNQFSEDLLPENQAYTISGDNQNGVIVTIET